MELWASGFNAWGQLDFQGEASMKSSDLRTFKCVLQSEHIEILRTSLSATLVRTSIGIKGAGSLDDLLQLCLTRRHGLSNIAIAGNEKVAEVQGKSIKEYRCLKLFRDDDGHHLGQFEYFDQIDANQIAFTALSNTGKVWTWGDGRYESCLGREISKESPAQLPYMVEDLSDLPTGPIRKISSGGYVTAALTAGNDLYVWGGRPGQPKVLAQLSETPEPVDLDGKDVLDVAVGVDHILALTTEHKLYVVGANKNGQLGLNVDELSEWKEVALPLDEKQLIVSVHAGYKNSFMLIENVKQ
ncbi:RCC1/BLIP-II [Stipitochalara longipes BDJ]|nr:RCC1/BLIP-II [Stipitochalara longipes BDJ]